MKKLYSLSALISKVSQFIGAMMLAMMVSITMLDIITRYLFKLTKGSFHFTIKGSVELISFCMIVALLCSIVAYIERSQIIVDIFSHNLSSKLKANFMGFFMFGYVILGIIFSLGFFNSTMNAIENGETTQDLAISKWVFYAIYTIAFIFLSIRSFIEGLHIFSKSQFVNAEDKI